MEITPHQFDSCLNELQPQIGDYEWMWRLLRVRTRKTGWFPRKMHRLILRLGNPKKPYFIAETCDGVKFVGDYRDEYAATCAVCPAYDRQVINFIKQHMVGEGVYLDVGTNLGGVAASIAKHMQGSGEVFAFEPARETARRAAATFALNNLRNVRLFPIAIGDEDKEITFFDAPGHSEWASSHKTAQEIKITWRETKVEQRSLDSLRREAVFDKVNFLKVDVEGHEPRVLQGAVNLLADLRPDILFEYNSSVAIQTGWSVADATAIIDAVAPYEFQALQSDDSLTSVLPSAHDKGVFNIYGKSSLAK